MRIYIHIFADEVSQCRPLKGHSQSINKQKSMIDLKTVMDSDMPDTKKQKTNPIKFKLMDSDQILEYDEQIALGSELISKELVTRSPSNVLPLEVRFEAFKVSHMASKTTAGKGLL